MQRRGAIRACFQELLEESAQRRSPHFRHKVPCLRESGDADAGVALLPLLQHRAAKSEVFHTPPQHVRQIGEWCDAAVVGSAVVTSIAREEWNSPDAVGQYVRALKGG